MKAEINNNNRSIRIDPDIWEPFVEVLERDGIKPSFAIRLFARMVGNGQITVKAPAILIDNGNKLSDQ